MSDISAYGAVKSEWLALWRYEEGSKEAEEAWEAKLKMDDGKLFSGAPGVVDDIQPYKSQITGECVTSRSKHRVHLKDHGCIEVGNEKQSPKPFEQPKGLRDDIARAVYQRLGG